MRLVPQTNGSYNLAYLYNAEVEITPTLYEQTFVCNFFAGCVRNFFEHATNKGVFIMLYAYQDSIDYQIKNTNNKLSAIALKIPSLHVYAKSISRIPRRTESINLKIEFIKMNLKNIMQKYFLTKNIIYSHSKYRCYIKINVINIFKIYLQSQN